MELHEQFNKWLTECHPDVFTFQDNNARCIVIRVWKNEDFDYLYCQRNYNGEGMAVVTMSTIATTVAAMISIVNLAAATMFTVATTAAATRLENR